MCSHITEMVDAIDSSAKGPNGWFQVEKATVYFDHPVHAPLDHALNIDFLNPGQGPSARVAVELSADTARALIVAIEAALAAGELAHTL
jgi:hypothetical protein